MSVRRSVGVLVAVALVGAVLGFTGAVIEGVVPDDSPVAAPAASAAPVAGGLGYTALASPCRAVDTRKPGVAGGDLANGDLRSFQMRGSTSLASQGGSVSGCGVPSTAQAVEVSITVPSGPVGSGFLRAAPVGTSVNAVFLNYTNGRGITNTGTVPLNTVFVQDLAVSNFGGVAHVIVDIQGFFAPSGGASYVPLAAPCRVVDTRNGGGPLGDNVSRPFQVAGVGGNFAAQGGTADGCGVPDGVPGVEVSLTVITPTGANGFVQVSPNGSNTSAAFINYTAGTGITNTGSITLSNLFPQDVSVRNAGGSIQVAIDVQGYYTTAPGKGTRYQTVAPCRTVDTRNAGGPLAPGQTRTFQTAGDRVGFASQGTANVEGCGVPQRATAVEASITAVSPAGVGFTRPAPAGSVPAATFLNYTPVGGITNTGTLPLALGGLADLGITNAGGTTSYIVDVLGYYEPSPEFPRSVEHIAAGTASTCSTAVGGQLQCWGDGALGSLGNGGVVGRSTPGRVAGLSGVVQTDGGNRHFCALLDDGTVRCWGDNESGQLGDFSKVSRSVPTPVVGLTGVVQIGLGRSLSCALTDAGTVSCWGENEFGQVGDGTTVDRDLPTEVPGLSDVVQVAAGDTFACALRSDRTVRCWGANGRGQLGDGSGVQRPTPVAVAGLGGVAEIALGEDHACARLASGAVRCWGANDVGQLGDGTTSNRLAPVSIAGVSGSVQVATGRLHSCALFPNGSAQCWGSNGSGSIGDGTSGNVRLTPVAVSGLAGAVQLDAGIHTCALLADGTSECWGYNIYGQVGDGTLLDRSTPTEVAGQSEVVQVAAGGDHACALLAVGQVRCWGDNGSGQLGDGTSGTDRSTPVAVSGLSGVVWIDAGEDHTCAVLFDRTARCWGFNGSGQLGDETSGTNRVTPVAVSNGSGATLTLVDEIALGGNHTCALRTNGLVFCWGFNFFGQLGDGLSGVGANASAPRLVGGGTARSITAGANHTCWEGADGLTRCWGANVNGQIGDNSPGTDRSTPTLVPLAIGVTSVAGGGSHTCGGSEDGTVRCWGRNAAGQIGDNTVTQRNVPALVSLPLDDRAVQVTAGLNHSCALVGGGSRTSQTVGCWGENADGQVGDGTSGSDRLTPVTVLRLSAAGPVPAFQLTAVAQVDAGGSHTCAALADGTARCWGSNSDGQLGTGSSGGSSPTASAVVTGLVDS